MKYAFFRLWYSLTWYKISIIYSLLTKKWVCVKSDFVNEQWHIKIGNTGRIVIYRKGRYLSIEYDEFWYGSRNWFECIDISQVWSGKKQKQLIMDFCRRWL